MTTDLSNWAGAERPKRAVLDGRYARLEPIAIERHEAPLLAVAQAPGAEERFRYLFDDPPASPEAFHGWMSNAAASEDPLFFAVVDKRTGRAEGRQALMRIDTRHGVIEIGNILWGPAIARSRVSTEALLLFAQYVFEDLGDRRFEWKCDNLNVPSKRAAERFGFTFEGVFRQHMVIKGRNRDTAWFAMTRDEWPSIKARFLAWLDPGNFDEDGRQKTRLAVSRR